MLETNFFYLSKCAMTFYEVSYLKVPKFEPFKYEFENLKVQTFEHNQYSVTYRIFQNPYLKVLKSIL